MKRLAPVFSHQAEMIHTLWSKSPCPPLKNTSFFYKTTGDFEASCTIYDGITVAEDMLKAPGNFIPARGAESQGLTIQLLETA